MKQKIDRWVLLVMAVGLLLAKASAAVETVAPAAVPVDAVVVLDNSGSMQKNDPRFLAKQGIRLFLQGVPSDTRLAIVIFDEEVRLALPLTPLSDQTRASVISSLNGVNYRGRFTDSPTALERALYELKLNGRAGAEKSILFLTDGIIDTGNKLDNLEGARWLREELAADAARNGIRMFAIVLGDKADFQLLHSLAQRTGGKYYRTDQPEGLSSVFASIGQSLTTRTITPDRVQPSAPSPTLPEAISAPAKPDTVSAEAERQSVPELGPTLLKDPRILWLIGVTLVLLLLATLSKWRLVKHQKVSKILAEEVPVPSTEEHVALAFLYDPRKVTGRERYPLTNRSTLVGRIAPGPGEKADHLLIKRPNISRRHALIEYKHLSYWLIDQKSANGTFVNGQRVTQEVLLKHGDKVRFDNVEFKFVWPGMEAAETTVITTRAVSEDSHVPFPGYKPVAAGAVAAEQDTILPMALPRIGDSISADLKDAMFPQVASRKLASHPIGSSPANRPRSELKDRFFPSHPSASFAEPKQVPANTQAKPSHSPEHKGSPGHGLSHEDTNDDLLGDVPSGDFPAWDVVSAALGGDLDLELGPEPSVGQAADKKASDEQPGSESHAEDTASDTQTSRPKSAEG